MRTPPRRSDTHPVSARDKDRSGSPEGRIGANSPRKRHSRQQGESREEADEGGESSHVELHVSQMWCARRAAWSAKEALAEAMSFILKHAASDPPDFVGPTRLPVISFRDCCLRTTPPRKYSG